MPSSSRDRITDPSPRFEPLRGGSDNVDVLGRTSLAKIHLKEGINGWPVCTGEHLLSDFDLIGSSLAKLHYIIARAVIRLCAPLVDGQRLSPNTQWWR